MREDITKRIDALNDELATRQESIDLLKGRLKNQIVSVKETLAKVLDKDTSLNEKIQTLFREQGITIASILTAIGMAIGVLVEALLPGASVGGGAAATSGGPPPKDEKGLTLSGLGGAQRPGWPNSQLPIRNLLSYDAQTWWLLVFVLETPFGRISAKLVNQGGCCCFFLIETSQKFWKWKIFPMLENCWNWHGGSILGREERFWT